MLWGALHPVCAHDMGHPASGTWVQAYFLLLAVLPSPGPGWLCPQHCRGLGASERGTLVGLRGGGSKQSSFRQQAEPVLAAHTGARPLLAPPRSMAKSSGALPPPTSGLAEEVSVHRAPGVHSEVGNGSPLQYSCLENSMERRSLAGYSLPRPRGCSGLGEPRPALPSF